MTGSPRPIPLSRPSIDQRDLERIAEALKGRTSGDGPFGQRVERRLSEMLAGRRVLLTTSCTHALELALLSLGVGTDQEVICPSFSFVSPANAALRVGARPVFADISEDTLGLDPDDVARRIGKRTAAIIPIHYAGVAAAMDELCGLARDNDLVVVEDAAHGLCAALRDQPLGTLGDAGCFSFHETKNVSSGEGGALTVRDAEVAARAEVVREKGTNRRAFLQGEVDKYSWVSEGSSYVISDLLAALLDSQLDKLGEIQRRRHRVVERYRSELAGWARSRGVRLPARLPERRENAHLFYMLLPDPGTRDRCLSALRSRGIGAAFHFVPLHSSPKGRALGLATESLPVTERVAATLVRLPLDAELSDEEVDRVVAGVRASLD